MNSTPP